MMIVLMKETKRAVRVYVTAGDSSKWSCLRRKDEKEQQQQGDQVRRP